MCIYIYENTLILLDDVCMYVCMYVCMQVGRYVGVEGHTYMRIIYIVMCISIYIYIYVYVRTHTYPRRPYRASTTQ